jgi:hypothetical protein
LGWIQDSSRGLPNQNAAHDEEGVNTGFEDGHVGWVRNPLGRVPYSYGDFLTTGFSAIQWDQQMLVGWRVE